MKEFRVENNDINTNMIYELKENELIDMVAVEMIQQNSNIPGLLKMIYTQNNSLRVLKYNITSKITLQQLLERNVTKKMIISILINTIRTLISADEYLLEQDCFILDMEKVFVDLGSYDVGMIYLPIKTEKHNEDYSLFFKNLILTSKYDATENCEYVARIISYLNSASFSLVGFYDFLHQIGGLKNDLAKNNNYIQQDISGMSANQAPDYTLNESNTIDNNVKTTVDIFADANTSNSNVSGQLPKQSVISEKSNIQMQDKLTERKHTQASYPKERQEQIPNQNGIKRGSQMQMPGQSAVSRGIQIPGQGPIPGESQISRQSEVSRAVQIPGQNSIPGGGQLPDQNKISKKNDKAGKKEKKKSRLFGRKLGKSNENVKIPKSDEQNINTKQNYNQAIPANTQNGMTGNNSISNNNILNNSMSGNSISGSSTLNSMPAYNMGLSNISQNNIPGFGETTVLGVANNGETTVLNSDMNPGNRTTRQAYLIRVKNGERIPIIKEKFLIGKEKSFVDYFIPDNTAISRSHAYIVNRNNDYYIVDTNSKNHTYIDGKLITPNTEFSINNDCKIKLADEEFIFSVM